MTRPAVAPPHAPKPTRRESRWPIAALTGLGLACLGLASCSDPSAASVATLDSPKESSEIAVLLQRFGISSATLESTTARRSTSYSVSVDHAEITAARYILDQLGLPRDDRGGLESLMDSGGVIPSRLSERGRLMHATADKLSRTLESHSRVLTARVHIVVPSEKLLGGSMGEDRGTTSSASVYLRWLPAWLTGTEDALAEPGSPSDAAAEPAIEEASGDERKIIGIIARSLAGSKGDYDELRREIPDLKDRADLGAWVQLRAAEVTDLMMGTTPDGAPISRSEIATLVANAVEGLSTLDVRVVYEQVQMRPGQIDPESGRFRAQDPVIRNLLAQGGAPGRSQGLSGIRMVLMAGLLAAAAALFVLLRNSAAPRTTGRPTA